MEFITPPKQDQAIENQQLGSMIEKKTEQQLEETSQDASQFLFWNLEWDMNAFEQERKVGLVKQRMYLLWLVVLWGFLWSTIWSYQTDIDAIKTQTEVTKAQIVSWQTQIDQFKESEKLLNSLSAGETALRTVRCLQNENQCGLLQQTPEWKNIFDKLDQVRSYFLLWQLSWAKMTIDQKAILQSFNDYYLVGKPQDSSIEVSIWTLKSLVFWKISAVDERKWLYKQPVNVTIEFSRKEMLDLFLGKIEKWIDPSSNRDRLLLKVESIDFNIVKYQDPQDVQMTLNIYFYRQWQKLQLDKK